MFTGLEALLARKNQRFVCRKGWPEPCPLEYVVAIKHEIMPALDSSELDRLREAVGNLPELLAFYSQYGSLRLYSDLEEDHSAFYIASPDEWCELKAYFTYWIDDLDAKEKAEMLPEWVADDDYVVIGEVPNSGNFFLMPLVGGDRGKVFEFEHDGFEFLESGLNFADFLAQLTSVDESLIFQISGHTRYSDSRPDSQWLIDEYLYDI